MDTGYGPRDEVANGGVCLRVLNSRVILRKESLRNA